jgi:hypothetical protein
MTLDKKLINYKFIDLIDNYNFFYTISYIYVRGQRQLAFWFSREKDRRYSLTVSK